MKTSIGKSGPSPSSIKIAHLSDLHFGLDGQRHVWKALCAEVKRHKPKLILITGDIVDSPNQDRFKEAKQCIDELKINYYVCPGNHDRYWKGVSMKEVVNNAYGRVAGPKSAGAWFDNVFGDRIPRRRDPTHIVLKNEDGTNQWILDIFSLDSSQDAEYVAQGFVSKESIDDLLLGCGKVSVQSDLSILLIHHHLLPIATLEQQKQSVKGLWKFTSMVNSGTVLEALASGNINLVLHGHEHEHYGACFRTVRGLESEVRIVGGGSSTGVGIETRGCSLTDASFNVLELREDHTVHLHTYRYEDDSWESLTKKETIDEAMLFNSGELRRLKLNRVKDVARKPISELTRHVTYTETRDILETEVQKNYYVKDGTFRHEVSNSTGKPILKSIKFEWTNGDVFQWNEGNEPSEYLTGKYEVSDIDDHTYVLKVDFKTGENLYATKITIEMKWVGGGLLSEFDLSMVEKSKRGPYRRMKKEYCSTDINRPLALFTLILTLPPKYSPQLASFVVFADRIEDREGAKLSARCVEDKNLHVESLGAGNFMLSVPYPCLKTRYCVAWGLPNATDNEKAVDEFEKVAKFESDGLMSAFLSGLSHATFQHVVATLYIQNHSESKESKVSLVACATVYRCPDNFKWHVPEHIPLDHWKNPYTTAYWRDIFLLIRDTSDAEKLAATYLMKEEVAMVVMPLCLVDDTAPLGIIRIGIKLGDLNALNGEIGNLFGSFFEARILLLNEFVKRRTSLLNGVRNGSEV